MRSARKPPAAGELHVWRVELVAGDGWGTEAVEPRGGEEGTDEARGREREEAEPRARGGRRRRGAAVSGQRRGEGAAAAERRGGEGEALIAGQRPHEDTARGAARRALAAILAEYLGDGAAPDPASLALAGGEDGKPRLAVAPGRLSFNLSHSGDLALIAIAPGGVEVGIDVERLRPRRDLARLAERRLPPADAAAISATPESGREAAFYAAWTGHEARVKCTGGGLSGPTPGPEVVAWQLEIDAGYAAAVAIDTRVAGTTEPHLTLRTWEPR